jgi:ribonucleotide reductase alpha subunit
MASPDRSALPEWAQAIVREQALARSAEEEAAVRDALGGLYTELPFSVNSLKMMAKRYLRQDDAGMPLETPEEMFYRVAVALAGVELEYGASAEAVERYAREFFSVMARFQFTPAGRTLANAGAGTKVVANCVVLHIQDSMESIMQTLKDAALLQKAGCGIGFPLHLMRPTGAKTHTSQGSSSGPISFLNAYNAMFGIIKQQNRHGANMAIMSIEHPDILEFMQCKRVEGSLKNFNISVGITDRFMRQATHDDPAVHDAPWKCVFDGVEYDPREIERDANHMCTKITPTPMSARALFARLVDSAWRNGEPGVVFLDTVNASNPVPGLGRIEASNPCGTFRKRRSRVTWSNECVCCVQASSFCTTATCATSGASTWKSSSRRRPTARSSTWRSWTACATLQCACSTTSLTCPSTRWTASTRRASATAASASASWASRTC